MMFNAYNNHMQHTEKTQRVPVVVQQREIEFKFAKSAQENPGSKVVVFFVPTLITPAFINPEHIVNKDGLYQVNSPENIPEGLIPASKSSPAEIDTVAGRVKSIHAMLDAGVRICIFCTSIQRPKADNLAGFVDPSAFEKIKNRLNIIELKKEEFSCLQAVLPAASYFSDKEFVAIYAQQINAPNVPGKPWGIDSENTAFIEPLKHLCSQHGIDIPYSTPGSDSAPTRRAKL